MVDKNKYYRIPGLRYKNKRKIKLKDFIPLGIAALVIVIVICIGSSCFLCSCIWDKRPPMPHLVNDGSCNCFGNVYGFTLGEAYLKCFNMSNNEFPSLWDKDKVITDEFACCKRDCRWLEHINESELKELCDRYGNDRNGWCN